MGKTILEVTIRGNLCKAEVSADLFEYTPGVTEICGDTIVTITKNIAAKDAVSIINICEKYGVCEEFFKMTH